VGDKPRRLSRFLFEPASPTPLALLRIGVSLILLFQAWYLAPLLFDLYGEASVLQQGLGEEVSQRYASLTYWLDRIASLGGSPSLALTMMGVAYVFSLVGLLLGWKTRLSAIAAWLLHLGFTYGQTTSYGLDLFTHVSLFLMIWVPAGAALSWDNRRGPPEGRPSSEARLGRRTLQIYLCLTYLASGLEKALGHQWWDGEAIWRSLTLPSLSQFNLQWMAGYPWLPIALGWGTLLIEIGYSLFIWPRRTRKLWFALTVGLHLGIGIFLGLWLFAFIMIVLNLAAFGGGLIENPRAALSYWSRRKKRSSEGMALG
jgi:hypothetical protein